MLFVSFSLVACSPPQVAKGSNAKAQSSLGSTGPSNPDLSAVTPPAPQAPVIPASPNSGTLRPSFNLCSVLNFVGIVWSNLLTDTDHSLLTLALNMSGSFEGDSGWVNLTNNFDGQGLSIGILNQNLGQGSLQPMLSEMRDGSFAALENSFSRGNANSLLGMLQKWDGKVVAASVNIRDYGYSDLDDLTLVAVDLGMSPAELQNIQTALLSRTQDSVDWAVRTLYNGTSFKSEWRSQLANLAQTAEYRSIQVEKAQRIHNSSLGLMGIYGLHQLRAYLFFYDVVVQNGSLSSRVQADFQTWLQTHARASEVEKLTEILNLRLRTVLARFVADVASRKLAIINGSGTVHAAHRDFAKEYCVDMAQTVF